MWFIHHEYDTAARTASTRRLWPGQKRIAHRPHPQHQRSVCAPSRSPWPISFVRRHHHRPSRPRSCAETHMLPSVCWSSSRPCRSLVVPSALPRRHGALTGHHHRRRAAGYVPRHWWDHFLHNRKATHPPCATDGTTPWWSRCLAGARAAEDGRHQRTVAEAVKASAEWRVLGSAVPGAPAGQVKRAVLHRQACRRTSSSSAAS
jgi:hypothetical protein